MPCTRYDEQQDQHGHPQTSFRSTFSQAFAGLRFSNQQNLHSFAIQPSHHNHHPQIAIIPQHVSTPAANANANNPDDVTEQIRISVQDTHISHGAFNDVGGNISDVLDSFEESILASQPQQGPSETNNSNDIRSGAQSEQLMNLPDPYISTASIPSTSSSTTTTGRLVDVHRSQPQSSSSTPHTRSLIVLSNIKSRNSRPRASPQTQTPTTSVEVQTINEVKKSNGDWSSNETDWLVNDTTHKPSDQRRTKKDPNRSSIYPNEECRSTNGDLRYEKQNQDLSTKRLSLFNDIPIFESLSPQATGVIKSSLYNGATFSGQQQSKEHSYEVNVKIQHVDFEQSYLYGYLCISHLTTSHPVLTTFFEGEIISEKHPFLTRKWEATSDIDLAHWSRFEGFTQEYARSFTSDQFDYQKLKNSDYIFMRWKEHFLVPDHTVKYVEGASYAGFYYICLNKRTSQIKGYYFHISEHFESFQSLDLEMDVGERSTQAFEFR